MEKENLPRLQRIISKYEGENRVATVDKIEKNHTQDKIEGYHHYRQSALCYNCNKYITQALMRF